MKNYLVYPPAVAVPLGKAAWYTQVFDFLLQLIQPLNTPILGDFETSTPPRIEGLGGQMQCPELEREMCVHRSLVRGTTGGVFNSVQL